MGYAEAVSTMNVSLPDEMRSFVEEQVDEGRFGSSSEYVRALIRREQDRQRLRKLVLAGAASDPGPIADDTFYAALRDRLDRRH